VEGFWKPGRGYSLTGRVFAFGAGGFFGAIGTVSFHELVGCLLPGLALMSWVLEGWYRGGRLLSSGFSLFKRCYLPVSFSSISLGNQLAPLLAAMEWL